MRLGFLLLLLGGFAVSEELNLDRVVVGQTLFESRELMLPDNDGNATSAWEAQSQMWKFKQYQQPPRQCSVELRGSVGLQSVAIRLGKFRQ